MNSVKGPLSCRVNNVPGIDVVATADTDSTTNRLPAGTGPMRANPELPSVHSAEAEPAKG